MISEKDILISANTIIEQYGDKAASYALSQIIYDSELDIWFRIHKAIQLLQNQQPDTVN